MLHIASFADVEVVLKPYIDTQSNLRGAYSLTRIKAFMQYLGNPQLQYKIVHVAGTSGKTSTSYYAASYLSATGKKVGLTVSPHIDTINERLQINMVPLQEREYCRQFSIFLQHVITSEITLTYFEVLVSFAYWYFSVAKVDYAVVEVGLGGLLDATNVIERPDKICIITDIGLDHTHILGKSLAEIASQKGGIIGPHNTVFMNVQTLEVYSVIEEICMQQQATLHQLQPPPLSETVNNLPLFQRRNWYLASQAFRYVAKRDQLVNVQDEQIVNINIPARMETFKINDKIIILDGAHNEQKMQALVASLRQRYPGQPVAFLASFVQSQNSRTKAALYELLPYADSLIITSFGGSVDGPKRSVSPTKVAQYCHEKGSDNWQVIADPAQAFAALLQGTEKVVVVTGSFYLFNHIRPLVKEMLLKQG